MFLRTEAKCFRRNKMWRKRVGVHPATLLPAQGSLDHLGSHVWGTTTTERCKRDNRGRGVHLKGSVTPLDIRNY